MKRTVGKIVIGAGLVLALAACGTNTQTGGATGSDAPTAVDAPAGSTADNGLSSNAPALGAAPNATSGANQAHGMPGVIGTVGAVNGSTLTLQDQRPQSTTTVDLTSSTQIFKQATIDLAKVSVGESISAVGSLTGDVFTATQVRIGTADGAGPMGGNGRGRMGRQGQPGGNGPGAAPGGAPNGTAQPGGMPQAPNGTAQLDRGRGQLLFGSVEQVSGDTITVKAADGTTAQVKLANNGQIMQQVTGSVSDITANTRIAALGEQNGTTVTASRIEILSSVAQQP